MGLICTFRELLPLVIFVCFIAQPKEQLTQGAVLFNSDNVRLDKEGCPSGVLLCAQDGLSADMPATGSPPREHNRGIEISLSSSSSQAFDLLISSDMMTVCSVNVHLEAFSEFAAGK